MLILPIEKEIETDHKIIGNFNLRQVLALSISVVAVVFFYFLIGNVFWVIICSLPFAFLTAVIGWYTKNGLMIEDLAGKIIQKKIYKNEIRIYRTKNCYFPVFNAAYSKKKAEERKTVEAAKAKSGKKGKKNVK